MAPPNLGIEDSFPKAYTERQEDREKHSLGVLSDKNSKVLDDVELEAGMDPKMYEQFKSAMSENQPLTKDVKKAVAKVMLDWALFNGATNFAHWASPIRGPHNLMKFDTFVDLDFSSPSLDMRTAFNAGRLFTGETDGSSYPNGGLRDTHCAAAFLTWDTLSPPFIRGDTMYIPSAFVSWRGHALDEKTPLLRSQEAVSRSGSRVLEALNPSSKPAGVLCNVGWEQEFFLVDTDKYLERPDLVATGRTLLGTPPARGQETSVNYFSQIPNHAKQILTETRAEMLDIGIPFAVYHNEVAPSQLEFSPIFRMSNVSADQNIASMEILKETAAKHGMSVLFHEKPFKGLNGSGKHSNWGINEKGSNRNLLVPGKTEEDQRSFVTFVACLVRAMDKHADMVRVGVATAGNDYRLGAQEAPPAIISLYTGDMLGQHLQKVSFVVFDRN